MSHIRSAATAFAIVFVLASCMRSETGTQPPAEAPATASPSITPSPAPAASPADTAQVVVDAALATMAEGTLRYEVVVRSADPGDPRPPETGQGQVSFGEPVQFRFSTDGASGMTSSADVIFDGERGFVAAGNALPPGTWLVIDLGPDVAQVARDAFFRVYGTSALVLVAPLGATEARVEGEEILRGVPTRRFVADVDISVARKHVPDVGLVAYETQVAAFESNGTQLTHELEVWVDPAGRVVRTRYLQDVASTAGIVVTYDFSDFGAPMEAAPPAGAEVLTIREAQERYRQTLESPSPVP